MPYYEGRGSRNLLTPIEPTRSMCRVHSALTLNWMRARVHRSSGQSLCRIIKAPNSTPTVCHESGWAGSNGEKPNGQRDGAILPERHAMRLGTEVALDGRSSPSLHFLSGGMITASVTRLLPPSFGALRNVWPRRAFRKGPSESHGILSLEVGGPKAWTVLRNMEEAKMHESAPDQSIGIFDGPPWYFPASSLGSSYLPFMEWNVRGGGARTN